MAKAKRFADGGVTSLLGSDTPQGSQPAASMTVNVTPQSQTTSSNQNPLNQQLTNQNFNAFSTPSVKTAGTNYKKGGKVRGCGLAQRGKTKGRMV